MLGLISSPGPIWLSVAPVDLRRGIDGLSAWVQHTLGQQPCAGSAFVFRNASGNRIKVCCGMAMAYGYVSAACIWGISYGPSRRRTVSRSRKRSGSS
jgi:hypothetical protein